MAVVEREVVVRAPLGFHMRPMQRFIEIAGQFRSDIAVRRPAAPGVDGVEVDGRSIFGLMELAATQGTVLTLRATGDDAPAVLDALEDFFKRGFDE